MRQLRMLALGASMLVLLSACSTGGGSTATATAGGTSAAPSTSASTSASASASSSASQAKPSITIGSDDFYESKLMAEIYAQVLEKAGYTVQRKLGLGSRSVRMQALEGGQIDIAPEYIGSGLAFQKGTPTGDPANNKQQLQAALQSKNITVLDYTPAQDQNGFVVRKDTASKYNLKSVSDLAKVASQLTWGLPPECKTNPTCADALKSSYGIDITKLNVKNLAACSAPIAQALNAGAVDVAELCTTQPDIARFSFVLLDDDKKSQPADNISPLVRNDLLSKVGDQAAFEKLLNDVSAKMTTQELTTLGVQVAVDQKDVATVAKAWLSSIGAG